MKQPEALFLAAAIERDNHGAAETQIERRAVNELRRQYGEIGTMRAERIGKEKELFRLHAVNQELVEALKNLLEDTQHAEHDDCDDGPCPVREARAALARAKEQE